MQQYVCVRWVIARFPLGVKFTLFLKFILHGFFSGQLRQKNLKNIDCVHWGTSKQLVFSPQWKERYSNQVRIMVPKYRRTRKYLAIIIWVFLPRGKSVIFSDIILHSRKFSSEMLQNLLYFFDKKNYVVFCLLFISCNFTSFLMNAEYICK